MKPHEFNGLFRAGCIKEGISCASFEILIALSLLSASMDSDIDEDNQLSIKGKFAINLITSKTKIDTSLICLRVFDNIVEKYLMRDKEERKDKLKP